jgi:nucleotide-binding universal stress UspA family protein
MFDKILLAVDGSEHGQHAARIAGELAGSVNAGQLHIVVALNPVPGYVGGPNLSQAIATREKEVQRIPQSAQETPGRIPAKINPEVIEAQIAEAILDVAVTRKCDVIVMRPRGSGQLEGAPLGSISQKVASHAPCPVLIVH